MEPAPRSLRPHRDPPASDLLDERGRPDFRDVYTREAARARSLDAALTRIRLSAMDLGPGELGPLRRIRVLLAEMNALALTAEAQALAADPERRERLRFLVERLRKGSLEVRLAPLAGWAPDFSVFSGDDGTPAVVLVGPHRLERPYPHPGPAFASVHRGPAAEGAGRRFAELWGRAHDLRAPLVRMLEGALRHGGTRGRAEGTSGTPIGVDTSVDSGYSFVPSEGSSGPRSRSDPA